jgi:hypothetical protein
MNNYSENGILTICLEGRIDSNNAAQTEKELFEALASASDADIIYSMLTIWNISPVQDFGF